MNSEMEISFLIAGISLMSSFAVYCYAEQNICHSNDLDLVLTVECTHPPVKWDMIKNIVNLFKSKGSVNSSGNMTVTLIDLTSMNNMTVNDSNIAKVSDLCLTSNEYDESMLEDNVLKLQNRLFGDKKISSKLQIIFIFQCQEKMEHVWSLGTDIEYTQVLFILISKFYLCWFYNSEINIVLIDNEDDLRYNNEISLILCRQCLDGWFPVVHETSTTLIKSCFLFEKHTKRLSWQDAAKYCARKKSHLATFETIWDFKYLKSSMVDLVYNYSNTPLPTREPLLIYIGLYSTNTRGRHRMEWVNYRPVAPFIYLNIKNNVNKKLKDEQFCFAFENIVVHNKDKGIIPLKCKAKRTLYTLCKQECLTSLESRRIKMSHSEIQRFALPNNNFINDGKKIFSIISKLDSGVDVFPAFVCDLSYPISYYYVCDGILDCHNGEDENICRYDLEILKMCMKYMFVCREPNVHGLKCIEKSKVCNFIEDCPDGSDESNCDDCIHTRCSPDVCIPEHWKLNCSILNHISVNTTADIASIENLRLENTKASMLEFVSFCNENNNDSNVNLNWPSKYNRIWAPKCIYMRAIHGTRLGCSDMSHLFQCKDFICPDGFSKCFDSYCIPDSFIFDGIMDCPHGEDEEIRSPNNEMYFQCYQSLRKIHPIYICDGKAQCPRADDELNCEDQCPSGFICLDGTVIVNDTSTLLNMSSLSTNTTFLNISGIDISKEKIAITVSSLRKLLVIIASHCNIDDDTPYSSDKSSVNYLDVSYNNFVKLTNRDFISQFSNLHFLNVSHNNRLRFIPRSYFQKFKKLKLLDISFTKITSIILIHNHNMRSINMSATRLGNLVFSYKAKYERIDLRNTFISDSVRGNFFKNISVKGKVLADYKLCCPYFRGPNLQAHQCESERLPLSTCDDLIGDVFKRVLLWSVALCAVIGNVAVLSYRILFERATLHLTYMSFVTCLGVSDFLMGLYLLIIASVDVLYRNIYIVHDKSWRQSTLCQIAGAMATISSETSTFFILLITLDRFLTIKFPFKEYKFTNIAKYFSISLSWCLGFLLSVIPIVYDTTFYSTSAMCLGLPFRKSSGVAWTYSVVVFLFLNSFLFFIIAVGQLSIFRSLSQHRFKFKNTIQNSARRAENVSVAFRLSLVVLSNFICWFPVCVMGIRAVVSDYQITRDTYAWIVVVVLPVNSALNPILYTAPRIYNAWKDSKRARTSLSVNVSL